MNCKHGKVIAMYCRISECEYCFQLMGNSVAKGKGEQIENESEQRLGIAASVSFPDNCSRIENNSSSSNEETSDNQQVITFVIHTDQQRPRPTNSVTYL